MNSSSSKTCDVVIVNYNAGGFLVDCVRSVASEKDANIFVVDNHSTDESLTPILAEYGSEGGVRIIRNPLNLGFSAACNIGFEAGSAPFVLFLNPDARLMPNSLKRLLNVLQLSDHVGMVGGFLCNLDGSEQPGGRRSVPTPWRSLVRAFGLYRLEKRWPRLFSSFYQHAEPLPDGPVEVEAISGACMLIRRSTLEAVGRWDESYFLHCEDLDLAMSIRGRGEKILFVPDAPVYHAHGACSRKKPLFVEWHKHKGMVRFYRKFFSHQYPGVLGAFVILGVWLHFGLIAPNLLFWQLKEKFAKHG